MSKAGERLIDGAREALAIAKGEKPAESITIAGHRYVHLPKGARILKPGQIDPETRERCAKVAEAEPNLVGDPPAAVVAAMEDAGPVMNARAAGSATKRSIAAAIRSLGDGK